MSDVYFVFAALICVSALLALFWLVRHIDRKSTKVADRVALWNERDYLCPACGEPMEQGWVMLGKGAIWSQRSKGKPGIFSSIGSALDNTISLSLRPASNMAWRCSDCRLLVVDHSKLVER
jgi:hypothetical protein